MSDEPTDSRDNLAHHKYLNVSRRRLAALTIGEWTYDLPPRKTAKPVSRGAKRRIVAVALARQQPELVLESAASRCRPRTRGS
jgi:hypothetical protein